MTEKEKIADVLEALAEDWKGGSRKTLAGAIADVRALARMMRAPERETERTPMRISIDHGNEGPRRRLDAFVMELERRGGKLIAMEHGTITIQRGTMSSEEARDLALEWGIVHPDAAWLG